MKNIFGKMTLAISLLAIVLNAQNTNLIISELIGQVNTQNLIHHIRILSGADTVRINKIRTTIKSRQVGQPDHDKARIYLKTTLEDYGYAPEEIYFNWYDHEICNLVVTKPGSRYPNQKYILCAHYDSYNPTAGEAAPGADDNASGIAAVLESARILQNIKTDYTILFAFWDAEELGRWGSEHFAFNAARDNDTILGVINLDMIAYDPENQSHFSINTCAEQIDFANTLANLTNEYFDSLHAVIYNPGSVLSDHQKFWNHGFTAVLITEAYRDEAQYYYYHTAQDIYQNLNFKFLHYMSKFALATISSLAKVTTSNIITELNTKANDFILLQNYPNPFNATTTISYSIPQASVVTFTLFNILGTEVAVLNRQMQSAGSYELRLDLTNYSTGLYFYCLQLDADRLTRRMMLIK